MNTPSERITIIKRSLRCFAMGWCSLVPPLGIVLFPAALINFQKARIEASGQWNPASRYLNWGMILAAIGLFISSLAFLGILALVWDAMN